jgi:hypothetical protein
MESGNKVVVEARLKGAGMHWALPHVNPMLALRNLLCSDRWQAGWQQITRTLRQQEQQRRKQLHQTHKRNTQEELPQPPIHSQLLEPTPLPQPMPVAPRPPAPRKSSIPAPHHPWRRSPIGQARFWPNSLYSKN